MPIESATPAHAEELALDAWAAFDEDQSGELVNGRLVEEEVPTILHEAVVSWLLHVLRSWAIARGGHVFGSEVKLAVAANRGRKPDLIAYLPGSKLPGRHSKVVLTPPSLVVEVLSNQPSDIQRDRVQKLVDYARFGIRFYWLVDAERRLIEILELGSDGRYAVALSASNGSHLVPGCDALALDIDDLWRYVDSLPEGE